MTNNMQKFIVEMLDDGVRLDKFLSDKLSDFSRSKIQGFVKSGDVLVNGARTKSSFVLSEGDEVDFSGSEEIKVEIESEQIDLDILRETDSYMVINKPYGMVVHPSESGHRSGTLVNAIYDKVDRDAGQPGREGIVHRLDKDTSGLMIIAKTNAAYLYFVELFKKRKVEKHYQALVFGSLEHKHGIVDSPIARDSSNRKRMAVTDSVDGRKAVSEFRVIDEYEVDARLELTLLDVEIKTGRTHQIRVHMSSIGYPVVMDTVYGNTGQNRKFKEKFGLERQFLHAYKLKFVDPSGEKISIQTKLPDDLVAVIEKLESY